jgi:hypothetical protein
MKHYVMILMVFMLAIVVGCGGSASSDNTGNDSTTVSNSGSSTSQEYDLSSNGIPAIVPGPAGAEIVKGSGNFESNGLKTINYVVEKDAFKLEATYTIGVELSPKELMDDAKSSASGEKGFVQIVTEEPKGFIYKLKNDEGEDYNFYYFLIKDGKSVEFEAGLNDEGNYTLEQVKTLFEAAKKAK